MEDNELAADQQQPRIANQNPKSYNFLLRMSKGMGKVATRSIIEMREFLNQEITITPTERFLAGMPRIKIQKQEQSSSQGGLSDTPKQDKSEGPQSSEQSDADDDTQNGVDTTENLNNIITKSHEVLAEANTVFPVTLFPDTVVVDRTKVTIIKRDFFWSSDTMTFRIEDVLNAEVTVGPIFGSLTIASRVMSTTDHFRIDHFWRKDAIYLKRIIQGYVIAQHNKIDVAHLSKDELIRTLNELGHHRSN